MSEQEKDLALIARNLEQPTPLPDFGVEKIKHGKKRAMCVAMARCGRVYESLKIAAVNASTHYKWLEEDKLYKEEIQRAKQVYCEFLEAEADRRATRGVMEPVFYEGRVCGYKVKYSDTMLAMRLNGEMPHKYKPQPNQVNVNTAVQNNVQVIQDDNWYDNSDRVDTQAITASDPDSNGQEQVEGNGMRKALGKNGNGTAGGH